MKRITAKLILTLCVVLYFNAVPCIRAADDAEADGKPAAAAPSLLGPAAGNPDVLFEDAAKDTPTSGTGTGLVVELNKLAEELCFQALTNFSPAPAPSPVVSLGGTNAPARRSVTRTSSGLLNRALTEFVGSIELLENERVSNITNEVVLEKSSKIGDTLKLNDRYNELKAALNDKNSPAMNDADLEDLVTLISGFMSPVKISKNGNGFGPEDYTFKATFSTNIRKFRLNIIKHDGKYLWFVEEGI